MHRSSLGVVRPNLFSNLSASAFVDTHKCEQASVPLPTQKKTYSKSACPCCFEERVVNGEYHFDRAGVSLAVCAKPEFLSKFDDAGVGLGAAEGTTFCVCSGCCKATRRALEKVRRAYPLTSRALNVSWPTPTMSNERKRVRYGLVVTLGRRGGVMPGTG